MSPDEQHYPWNAYLVSIFSRLLPHFQLSHHFPPVTTCPFNVNLSPFSQAPHSYRVSPPLPHLPPTADCQKNNFLFSPDSLLSFSCLLFVSRALLRVGMGGGEVAKLRQMFISPLPLGRATLPRMDGLRFTTGPMWPSKRDPQPSSAATWISPAWAWSTWQPVVGFGKQLALLCTSGY